MTGFRIDFIWLGNGTPGSQPFEIYDVLFNTVASGQTVPVPEPTTFVLIGAGLVGVHALNRRRHGLRPNGPTAGHFCSADGAGLAGGDSANPLPPGA